LNIPEESSSAVSHSSFESLLLLGEMVHDDGLLLHVDNGSRSGAGSARGSGNGCFLGRTLLVFEVSVADHLVEKVSSTDGFHPHEVSSGLEFKGSLVSGLALPHDSGEVSTSSG